MYCANCGHEIREGASFCAECGAPVASRNEGQAPQEAPAAHETEQAQPAPETPQTKSEPDVAQKDQPPSVPKQEPASDLSQSQTGQNLQSPAPKKRRGLIIGIVAGVAAVAAIAAVVVFVVLPKAVPHGIWIATKITTERKGTADEIDLSSLSTKNIDKNGVLVSETYKDSGKSYDYTSETSYTNNQQGFCESSSAKSQFSTSSSDGIESSNKYDWTFGSNGMPSKLTIVDDDDERMIYTYEYDDKGNIRKRNTDIEGGSYSVSSEFDEKGHVSRVITVEDGKTYETSFEYEYDASGRTTSCTYTRLEKSTGKKALEGKGTFELDENGNIRKEEIKETTYDLEGKGKKTDAEVSNATNTYEYTYVEDPLPWVATLAHLYTVPNATTY